eukprot:jgi/Chlat1/4831/Chrsp31S04805
MRDGAGGQAEGCWRDVPRPPPPAAPLFSPRGCTMSPFECTTYAPTQHNAPAPPHLCVWYAQANTKTLSVRQKVVHKAKLTKMLLNPKDCSILTCWLATIAGVSKR